MKVIADLEIHSKYARAVSPQMTIPTIAEWAKKKGIDLVGTGDFTHPLWLREIEANLEEAESGVYRPKDSVKSKIPTGAKLFHPSGGSESGEVRFLLTCEVSCIYTDKGKGRKIHIFVYLPSLAKVHEFNTALERRGCNLFSDGRPIIPLTLRQLAEIALMVEPKAIIIPAHVWTPWFGFYGDKSGYDSLFEAFGDLEKYIPAVETGLSSDPAMNWRIEELANKSIVSFSDAHSPAKMGREATVFELSEVSFENVRKAIASQISYTIEFYPEEGKYHYTGHRNCNIVYSPNEARKKGIICPVCGRSLTMGVMGRVEHLGKIEIETETEKDKFGVRWIKDKNSQRPAYVMLVPLMEILAEALGSGVASQKIVALYDQLTSTFGSEFNVLLDTDVADIRRISPDRVAEAISKVRSGDIAISPGYDGVFGRVSIWPTGLATENEKSSTQETLF